MNKLKRFSATILVLLVMFSFPIASKLVALAEQTTYQITDIIDKVKIDGRHEVLANGVTCDWSASGIEFNATCSGDASITYTNTGVIFFSVYIDGVRQPSRIGSTASGTATVKFAENLTEGTHTFKIIKQTENINAKAVLTAISLNGTIGEKPADSDTYIEFMGDSITCGYGVVADSTTASVADSYHQDATQTYAYLTAQNFNADSSFVSVSGMGLVKGFATYKLADVYEYTSRPRDMTSYDFARTPNVVVINIGTNDSNTNADTTTFMNGIKSFITTVRSHYENVPIVFCYYMMNANYRTYIQQAIDEVTANNGEANGLYVARLTQKTSSACGGHPTPNGHITSANLLSAFFVEKGILSESKLSPTATAILSPVTVSDPMIWNCNYPNSSITYGGGIFSSVSGIATGSADANALQIVSSSATNTLGTQITLSSSFIKSKMANSKGIRFYINYTGNMEKNVNVSNSDKNCTVSFDATEGVTTCVDVLWEDIGGSASYEYLAQMLSTGNIGNIKFNFGTGDYTVTLDDIQYLYKNYSVSSNPNSTYVIPTTAATTTIAGDSTVYLATNCSPTGSPTPLSGDVSGINYVYSSAAVSVGDYVTFTLPNVTQGTYSLYTTFRRYTGRASFQTSVDGVDMGAPISYSGDTAEKITVPMNIQFTTTQTKNVTIKLTATAAGTYYFFSFTLQKTGVSTTTGGTTGSTIATTTTVPTTIATTTTTQATTTETPTTVITTEPTTQKIIYGDVNGDGTVNGKDSMLLRQYIAEWDVNINEAAADVNGDSFINSKDTLKIRMFIAEIISSLEP